jgi:hypothetical protein
MAIQSKAQSRSGIGACAVENPAKLWKALAVGQAKNPPKPYEARVSAQDARRLAGGMENRQSVENFHILGAETAANSAVFRQHANLKLRPFWAGIILFHVERSRIGSHSQNSSTWNMRTLQINSRSTSPLFRLSAEKGWGLLPPEIKPVMIISAECEG